MKYLLFLVLSLSLVQAGCDEEKPSSSTAKKVADTTTDDDKDTDETVTEEVTVTISPATATVQVGATQSFSATVEGADDTSVTWSVKEGASGGSITSGGTYTAPNTPGTYHVVATSKADSTKTAEATVTVTSSSAISVAIAPNTVDLYNKGTTTLTATVNGTTNQNVNWTVVGGAANGTITAGGVYTAPNTEGTFQVRAQSLADTSKVAFATLNVTLATGSVFIKLPAGVEPTVEAGATLSFDVAVLDSVMGNPVTWYAVGVTPNPVAGNGTFTAPATAGTYTIVAVSKSDSTKTDTIEVTVTEPVLDIEIDPSFFPSVETGGTLIFSASITSSIHDGITYSVETTGGGAINPTTGVYSAPVTKGFYTLRATSVYDSSVFVDIVVEVRDPIIEISVAPYAVTTVESLSVSQYNIAITTSMHDGLQVWLREGQGPGGFLNQTGADTWEHEAPATAGTYHIDVTSITDPNVTATIMITVEMPTLYIDLSPTAVTVTAEGTQQFNGSVTTVAGTAALEAGTFYILEADAGTIDQAGLYTAPITPGTYTVVFESTIDSGVSLSATVEVLAAYCPAGSRVFHQFDAAGLQTMAQVVTYSSSPVTTFSTYAELGVGTFYQTATSAVTAAVLWDAGADGAWITGDESVVSLYNVDYGAFYQTGYTAVTTGVDQVFGTADDAVFMEQLFTLNVSEEIATSVITDSTLATTSYLSYTYAGGMIDYVEVYSDQAMTNRTEIVNYSYDVNNRVSEIAIYEDRGTNVNGGGWLCQTEIGGDPSAACRNLDSRTFLYNGSGEMIKVRFWTRDGTGWKETDYIEYSNFIDGFPTLAKNFSIAGNGSPSAAGETKVVNCD